jgi:DNA polymerase III epsilon subunit-like protein
MEALSFPEAYYKFLDFILHLLEKRKKKWVCLISHNGFRSDKIVLEHELHYHRLPMYPFFFLDSLLYIREVYPGLQSYSLENVYKNIFNETYNAHNAETDTNALYAIIRKINKPLHGVLYPMLTIPLRNVTGIGYNSEQSLLYKGVLDISSLYFLTGGDKQKTNEYLLWSGVITNDKLLESILHWYKLTEMLVLYRKTNDALGFHPPPPSRNL